MNKLVHMLCLLVPLAGISQFNDTTSFYVNHASTGIMNKTNEGSSYVLNNNLKFSYSKKIISLNSHTMWVYGKQQNTLTNNDFSSGLDFNIYKTIRHLYYWGLVNYDKIYSLKINNRLQTGVGIGYNIIDRKAFIFNLSDGLIYEKGSLYEVRLGEMFNYELFRNSLRIKFKLVLTDVIFLDGTNFLQNALSDEKDYIIKTNTNLNIKLKKWLSFTTSLSYNKLNLTGKENLLLTFGLALDRYF